ncbi:hypothetical protein LPJ56_000409 [Coemansia sp. RSA 2599]|nr:hypothetical protein LPJ56_000409 [Coemansia sp. RSA 2599]
MTNVCSVTLAVLASPGSDQCSTCLSRRRHGEGGNARSDAELADAICQRFPLCPVCKGAFYPAVA